MSNRSSGNNIKGLDINFQQKLTSLPQTITDMPSIFSRASTKYVMQDGQLVQMAVNQFGTSWDTYGGGYAPTEQPSATNEITYSGDLNDAVWSKTNVSLTSGETDPYGGTGAWKITSSSTAATTVYVPFTATSTKHTCSFFLKAGTRTSANLMIRNNTTATNFQTSTLTFTTFAVSGTATGWECVPISDGWFFCRYTNSSTETITAGDTLHLYAGANGNSVTSGQYWYFCWPQAETGNWNTAYIPTTSAPVTRGASQYGIDYLNKPGSYGAHIESAATNSLLYSTLAGGGTNTAPTGWTGNHTTGSFAPISSTLGSDSTAYTFTDSGGASREYIYNSITLVDNTTYSFSVYVEATDGIVTAREAIALTTLPGGASIIYPQCDANPKGTADAVIRTGRLHYRISGTYTGGANSLRIGQSCTGTILGGTCTLSRPQFETGNNFTSYIPTTSGTATRSGERLCLVLGDAPNLLARSNNFVSSSHWGLINCTVAQNVTDPFGTANNAWTLTTTATSGTSCQNVSMNMAPSTTLSYSCYVKQGTRSSCNFRLINNTTLTVLANCSFTFASATVTNTVGTTTAEDVGSGWYRLKTTVSSGISIGDNIRGYAGTNSGTYTAGDTVLIYGAQLETGNSVGAYSETNLGGAVDTPYNSQWSVTSPYVLYADVRKATPAGISTGEFIWYMNTSSGSENSNRHDLFSSSSFSAQGINSSGANLSVTGPNANIYQVRYAFNFETNNGIMAVNGHYNSGFTDTAGDACTVPYMMNIGGASTGTAANFGAGYIYNLKWLPGAMTSTQLQKLTRI